MLHHFLFSFPPPPFFRSIVCYTALSWASLRKLLSVFLASGCSPSSGVDVFSDIWNCIKHWSFLNPHIVPLGSHFFFPFFSSPLRVIHGDLVQIISSHKTNPAGFGDQHGVPKGQTESHPRMAVAEFPAEPRFCCCKRQLLFIGEIEASGA